MRSGPGSGVRMGSGALFSVGKSDRAVGGSGCSDQLTGSGIQYWAGDCRNVDFCVAAGISRVACGLDPSPQDWRARIGARAARMGEGRGGVRNGALVFVADWGGAIFDERVADGIGATGISA